MSTSSSDEDNLNPIVILRKQRMFRPVVNIELSDIDFKQRFRLCKGDAERLLIRIGGLIQHPTQRSHSLSPKEQLLSALRFLATGSFYRVIGDAHGPSESTICRNVQRVISAINSTLFDEVIRWPAGDAEIVTIPYRFREICGMPCVCVGASMVL
jgi:hypothetical protein